MKRLIQLLLDPEVLWGCAMAFVLGMLLLLPFAAKMYAPELLALLGR